MQNEQSPRRIGRAIHRLGNRIHRYLDNCGASSQINAITCNNAWIIRYLCDRDDHDVYQKDLETELGITRSTASRIVKLMEQKGLIVRQGVEHDARLKKLVLTQRAREVDHVMRLNGQAADRQMLYGFTPEEIDTLFRFIDRMIVNMEVEPPKDPAADMLILTKPEDDPND